MLYLLFSQETGAIMAFLGILSAFAATIAATGVLAKYLPKDAGRAFAHAGKLSAGKPRGAGIIFVTVFALTVLLFVPLHTEYVIYLVLLMVCMFTGFFDDASAKPWNEYKKGILDLAVAVMVAFTFLKFNDSTVEFALFGTKMVFPPLVFGILTVILVWASVNVTNCADGVDGLSGTLTIITLSGIYLIDRVKNNNEDFLLLILMFVVCILGYLWYNATPSRLMMGDAGSRAMGLFISIAILKTKSPFLYIPVALVLILDGGLGLIKVSLLRFLKISILKNVRLPLHDHVRKKWGWSDTQTVYRFAMIQIILIVAVIYGMQFVSR